MSLVPLRLSDLPQTLFSRGPIDAKPLWSSGREPRHALNRKTVQRLCDLVMVATAAAFALPVGELNAATRRSAYAAFARQSAMYLAHVAFSLSYAEVGSGFHRDRKTAMRACLLIEERRDDPAVDSVLASLEDACGALRRRLAAPVSA